MDTLQWMGTFRMRLQTADKNITICFYICFWQFCVQMMLDLCIQYFCQKQQSWIEEMYFSLKKPFDVKHV